MPKSPNALELLRKDHRSVLTLLRRFDKSRDEREQHDLCGEIVAELAAHTALEEDCFYPYVREATDRLDLIEEATIEHGTAKELMQELGGRNVEPARFHALVKVLGEYVTMHVREEEERIFPVVEKLGIDLEALGAELAERKGMPAHGNGKRARAPRTNGKHDGHARRHDGGEGTTKNDEKFVRAHGDELSRSTQHAKWIHSTDDHEDHSGQTLATRNPDVIRQWADERKAQPATTPGGDAENPRVLRFDFPGYDRELQAISWDAWLRTFDERDLVFLYQEHMKAGNQSNFFRLDSPHREEG
ncbi:MAG TPA: hemerythrin domain-containing protein [Casimicrobiaceae bacterium]